MSADLLRRLLAAIDSHEEELRQWCWHPEYFNSQDPPPSLSDDHPQLMTELRDELARLERAEIEAIPDAAE